MHNGTSFLIKLKSFSLAIGNEIFDTSSEGIRIQGTGGRAFRNYLYNGGTRDFTSSTAAITVAGAFGHVIENIISIDGTSNGIYTDGTSVTNGNSILSAGGTGSGLIANSADIRLVFHDNLVEGFSDTGGFGFEDAGTVSEFIIYANNSFYNNETDQSPVHTASIEEGNENLGSSPFAKSGADTFANRFIYFEPNDVGNVRGAASINSISGAYLRNNLDRGAVQHADAGGGGDGANILPNIHIISR